jgi:hypothetical protein
VLQVGWNEEQRCGAGEEVKQEHGHAVGVHVYIGSLTGEVSAVCPGGSLDRSASAVHTVRS